MRSAFLGPSRFILAVLSLSACLTGLFGAPLAADEEPGDHELEAASAAAYAAMITGPRTVKLIDQAALVLSAEDGFVPKAEAVRLMQVLGNSSGPDMLGLVLPRKAGGSWFISVGFQKLGFLSSAVLSRLTNDDIHEHMRRAARHGNDQRQAQGIPKIDLGEFVDPPSYDPKLDRMSMTTRIAKYGSGDDLEDNVQFDAYVFGRDGVLSLTLSTHAGGYANLHHHMDQLFNGASFVPGKRSNDIVASDKRAEYPLEVLFGGQTVEDVAKDKAAAAARIRKLEMLEGQRQEADREWQFYLIAGAASLLLSSIAVFAFNRAVAA